MHAQGPIAIIYSLVFDIYRHGRARRMKDTTEHDRAVSAVRQSWGFLCSFAIFSSFLGVSCGSDDPAATALEDATLLPQLSHGGGADPVVTTSAELHEVPVPLARKLTVSTNKPTRVTITISDGVESRKVKFKTYATSHELPVLGLKFNTAYTVSVKVKDKKGNTTDAGTLAIPPISPPATFPSITKNVTGNADAEPGFLMFTAGAQHLLSPVEEGYVIITDANGDVVWLYEAPFATEVLRLENGNLLIQSAPTWHTNTVEVDMLGQTVRTWVTRRDPAYTSLPAGGVGVDIDSFHHDMRLLPSGRLITMSTELRHVPDFPRAETNVNQALAPANFANPTLAELDLGSGEVLRRWSVVDAGPDYTNVNPPIDYKRVGYQSLRNRFWADLYGVEVGGNSVNCGANGINLTTGAGTCYDWGHFTSFWYDEATDTFLMSLRHLAAIVSFNGTTGQLNWILGAHRYWSPSLEPHLLSPPAGSAASFWPYYAHNITMTSGRTIMMFDNHNYEALPPDPPLPAIHNNSRVAEFQVENGDVELVWEYVHPVVPGDELNTNLYAPTIGSANEMPETGNILIDFGGICKVHDNSIKPPSELGNPGEPTDDNRVCKHWGRIIEVTHDASKQVVFDIRVGNTDLADPLGWNLYRATKLKHLYP
jgi:arylsulfate sulfotransferase